MSWTTWRCGNGTQMATSHVASRVDCTTASARSAASSRVVFIFQFPATNGRRTSGSIFLEAHGVRHRQRHGLDGREDAEAALQALSFVEVLRAALAAVFRMQE